MATIYWAAIFLVVNVGAPSFGSFYSGYGSSDEARLLLDKFKGYNSLIRPAKNANKTLVSFGIVMTLLINVDEKNQVMQTNVWLNVKWHDFQLEWNPDDYGGIEVIQIPPDKTWLPDIVLFNNADGNYEVSFYSNVVLRYTGEIIWIPPAIYKSSCVIDVRYFPFDEQVCPMYFRSWTYSRDEIMLDWYNSKPCVELSDYAPSGIWDIIDVPGTMLAGKSQVVFHIRIRRKALFYTVILIVPTVLMAFLSVMVFLIPADASEKMTLAISIQLALVVFLLLVSKMLPPSSDTIPLMAKYLLVTFSINVITIFATAVIININFRSATTHVRMSGRLRWLFLNALPTLLCMTPPRRLIGNRQETISNRRMRRLFKQTPIVLDRLSGRSMYPKGRRTTILTYDPTTQQTGCCCQDSEAETSGISTSDYNIMLNNNIQEQDVAINSQNRFTDVDLLKTVPGFYGGFDGSLEWYRRYSAGFADVLFDPDDKEDNTTPQLQRRKWVRPELREGIRAVKFISEHANYNEHVTQSENEWRYVGMVIDRLLLLVFSSVTLASTIGILLSAPRIFERIDQKEIIARLKAMYPGAATLDPYTNDSSAIMNFTMPAAKMGLLDKIQ